MDILKIKTDLMKALALDRLARALEKQQKSE